MMEVIAVIEVTPSGLWPKLHEQAAPSTPRWREKLFGQPGPRFLLVNVVDRTIIDLGFSNRAASGPGRRSLLPCKA